jgi:hypothetical protein
MYLELALDMALFEEGLESAAWGLRTSRLRARAGPLADEPQPNPWAAQGMPPSGAVGRRCVLVAGQGLHDDAHLHRRAGTWSAPPVLRAELDGASGRRRSTPAPRRSASRDKRSRGRRTDPISTSGLRPGDRDCTPPTRALVVLCNRLGADFVAQALGWATPSRNEMARDGQQTYRQPVLGSRDGYSRCGRRKADACVLPPI